MYLKVICTSTPIYKFNPNQLIRASAVNPTTKGELNPIAEEELNTA